MNSEWARRLQAALDRELAARAVAADAGPMQAYMKDVAPFLGVKAPARRVAVRETMREVGRPTEPEDLAAGMRALWSRPEREFTYAACDVAGRLQRMCGADFLTDPVEDLLLIRPWWDSVDALGNAVISPVCGRDPAARAVIRRWSDSGDRWLIRAAIGCQRGAGGRTDAALLFELCARHSDASEFFIAKAIGWALRDYSRIDPGAVGEFVGRHPELDRVAVREARRGIERARAG